MSRRHDWRYRIRDIYQYFNLQLPSPLLDQLSSLEKAAQKQYDWYHFKIRARFRQWPETRGARGALTEMPPCHSGSGHALPEASLSKGNASTQVTEGKR